MMSSSSSSSVAKGKKRYREKDHHHQPKEGSSSPSTSTKRRISENAGTAERVTTRGMMRQMLEQEGLGNHHEADHLVHEVKMIQELPEEMKDTMNSDEDVDEVDKQPALLEWDHDFGWNPSWVFEEKLGLCGSWDWDWIWYPYWDMMVDNWAFDGDDEIVWEDDIWSLQHSNANENQTAPKK